MRSRLWGAIGAVTLLLPTAAAGDLALPGETNLTFKAEASVKETYDSNVYIEDVNPNPAGVAAAKAAGLHPVAPSHSSWVTSIVPKIGLDYRMSPALKVGVSYTPDVNFYHSASSEDYVAHRGTLTLGGKLGQALWELSNVGVYIDGNTEGPTFARPEDVPAIGGIPLRDRRAAFVYRNNLKVTEPLGDDWFIRPVAATYIHDFKTEQRPGASTLYAYENYIDRQDINGGLDLGYRVMEQTHLVLGYRYGRQDQFKGPYGPGGSLTDSPFDSAYHRVLVGLEGSPAKWVKVNLMIGPDIRQFSSDAHRIYPSFDPDTLLYYLDGSVTFLVGKAESIMLKATRYEQPAFSSFSVYEDIKNDLVWRHQFNEQVALALGFTLYIGDWQSPVSRNDWIYTPNASLTYALTSKLLAEFAYSYDAVESYVSEHLAPFGEGREFTRHLASVGLRYTF